MPSVCEKWLYLPVEVKVRDLRGKLLLACTAAEKGFKVVMGYKDDLAALCKYFPSGVFFSIGLHENYAKANRLRRSYGHMIAAIDEEGLVTLNDALYVKLRVSKATLQTTDLLFAWGARQARAVGQKTEGTGCRIEVTGHPRFDLLRSQFRSLIMAEADSIKRRYGKFVLVNTNFGLVNHFRGQEFGIRIITERYGASPECLSFMRRRFDLQREILGHFRSMLIVISKAFGQYNIVLRPHPSENRAFWKECTQGLSNVRVIHEGDVLPWLLASALVIQNECTTAVEAFLLDVPVISFRPVRDEMLETTLPNAVSRQVLSVSDLVACIDALSNGKMVAQRDSRLLNIARHYIEGITGPLASDRIAAILADIEVEPRARNSIMGHTSALRLAGRCLAIRRFGRLLFSRRDSSAGYVKHKFSCVTRHEIRSGIDALARLTGRFANMRVTPIGCTCFCIDDRSVETGGTRL